MFVVEREDQAHWIAAGRARRRFALRATLLGLEHAFVNQSCEVARRRPGLASVIGKSGLPLDMILRFGYCTTRPYAPRRPPASPMSRR